DRAGRRRRAPARVPRGARAVRGRAVSAALPGDTRLSGDRLAWLLASLALVLVPHATRLPFWITGAFVVLAVWRLGAWRARWPLPPAWLRATLAVLGFAAVGLQFRAWGGQEAGIAMLVVMLALKLTETTRK